MMKRAIPTVVGVLILVVAGVVHGRWTGRWEPPGAMTRYASALKRVPTTVGDWAGRADTLDDRTVKVAGIDGYFLGQFVNGRTGASSTVMVVCGRPGPISVHTPEVCYGGSGYVKVG